MLSVTNCSRGIRLSLAALASTKLPSTDNCWPRTNPSHTLAYDLFEQLLEQLRLLKPPVSVLGERGMMRNLLIEAQPGEPPHAKCMRNSSTSLRSLVTPYRYPIRRMRNSSSGSTEGRPVSL